jgi:hypothetical protein
VGQRQKEQGPRRLPGVRLAQQVGQSSSHEVTKPCPCFAEGCDPQPPGDALSVVLRGPPWKKAVSLPRRWRRTVETSSLPARSEVEGSSRHLSVVGDRSVALVGSRSPKKALCFVALRGSDAVPLAWRGDVAPRRCLLRGSPWPSVEESRAVACAGRGVLENRSRRFCLS